MSLLAKNKRAYFDYTILETYEAGLVLLGHEVKSIRGGHINLTGSYITHKQSRGKSLPSFWLTNANVPLYEKANKNIPYDPVRSRQLLLKKSEIKELVGKMREKHLTMLPLTVYSKKGKIKISFGIGRGKKKYDKRAVIRQREDEAKINRALRQKS